MRTAITIVTTKKGETAVLFGPDVPADEQRTMFAKYSETKMPGSVVRMELWVSDRGRIRKLDKHGAVIAPPAPVNTDPPADQQQQQQQQDPPAPDDVPPPPSDPPAPNSNQE